jgi:hypothetical protein
MLLYMFDSDSRFLTANIIQKSEPHILRPCSIISILIGLDGIEKNMKYFDLFVI